MQRHCPYRQQVVFFSAHWQHCVTNVEDTVSIALQVPTQQHDKHDREGDCILQIAMDVAAVGVIAATGTVTMITVALVVVVEAAGWRAGALANGQRRQRPQRCWW